MRQRLSDPGRRRRIMLRHGKASGAVLTAVTLGAALVAGVSASAATGRPAAASSSPAYLDAHQPVQARVSDLLGRLTLAEKIGQMVQIEQSNVTDTTSACTSQGGFNVPNPVCEQ